jgi:hypothetical protein
MPDGDADALLDGLGDVLTRWTMGGATPPPAPAAWRPALGDAPDEAALRLLALAGHFLGTMVRAEPGDGARGLHVRPDLPRLALPTVADALRPLVRHALRQAGPPQAAVAQVLDFVARRGWTVHPADGLPAAADGAEAPLPDVYLRWRDWARSAPRAPDPAKPGADAPDEPNEPNELNDQTWGAFAPGERERVFKALRRSAPDAARAVLETRLAGEDAAARLRLVQALAIGLAPADAPLLETLVANDRAPKVKAEAAALLARLGRATAGGTAGEDADELAGFFELRATGLLRRGRELAARALKTPAQHARRQALMAQVDFAAWAGALGLAPPELIAA